MGGPPLPFLDLAGRCRSACWPARRVCAADAPDHVVLQLKWLHQFQFAGYYAAVAQGYYRDAGLDVTLQEAVSLATTRRRRS